jgi:hypothetical protein
MSPPPTCWLAAALTALAAAAPAAADLLPSQADAVLSCRPVAGQCIKDARRLAALRRQADCYQRCLAASRAAVARLPAADLPDYLRGLAQREASLNRILAEIGRLERRVAPGP